MSAADPASMRSPDSLLSSTDPGRPRPPGTPRRAQVEIVIPVRNEEHEPAT